MNSAGAQEVGDKIPSPNLASKLERRVDDLIAAKKLEAIEACNDYFYVLSKIGASKEKILSALEKYHTERGSLLDADRTGYRTSNLLSNYPLTTAKDLQTVQLAIIMGAGAQILTEPELLDLAEKAAAVKCSNSEDVRLKTQTLRILAEKEEDNFDFQKKCYLAAIESGMSNGSMPEEQLQKLFNWLVACYDRPSSRPEDHDIRLVKAVQNLTNNATVLRKHEFLVRPELLDEMRLCSNLETLQSTQKALAEKMEFVDAAKPATANAFTELGCAYLLCDNFESAAKALEHALVLHRHSTTKENLFPLVARLALAECYRQAGEFDKSREQLHFFVQESAYQNQTHCFPAYAQTVEGMIFVKQRKFSDAVRVLSLADDWWRKHQEEQDQVPFGHKYIFAILPGEAKCLAALAEALEATGKHKAAAIARADMQKVLSDKAELAKEIKQGNDKDAQLREREFSEATKARLTSLKFDAQLCAKIIHDRYSPARVPVPADCKYQLLDYCHALSAEKRYDEAKRAAIALLQSKGENLGECGALLAFVYSLTGHAGLAETTIKQAQSESLEGPPRSVSGSASQARSQSYVYYYAGLIALKNGNALRAQRLFSDARRWLAQPVLKGTPLAEKLESQIRDTVTNKSL